MEKKITEIESDYDSRFNHRRKEQIEKLAELTKIAHPGGPEILEVLPKLFSSFGGAEIEDALRVSILMLYLQAAECYIFGQFEPCILTCGAILERCLKLEYRTTNGELPKGRFTLGKCVNNLDWQGTRISSDILEIVSKCIGPRNSFNHALLEHEDPSLSILGGQREFYKVSEYAHVIERFRGDARDMITNTWEVVKTLYS